MQPVACAVFAATVLSSLSCAQLPGQAYIVTINGTVTTVIEPLDAPAATFSGTDSLGAPTTVETTEPVTASTTPVAISLTQLIGVSSPTSSMSIAPQIATPGSTRSATSTATGLSGSAIGSPDKSYAAPALRSSSKIVIGLNISLGLIILAIRI